MKVLSREHLIFLLQNAYAKQEYFLAIDLDKILTMHGKEARMLENGELVIKK